MRAPIFVAMMLTACHHAQVPCDPLAPDQKPITLGSIIAAGVDSGGRIYVANDSSQVFVSSDGVLQRWRVRGSGTGVDHDLHTWEFEVEHEAELLTVLIEKLDGITTMAIGPEDYEGRIADLGDQGEILALTNAATVRNMPLENLPGDIEIEYLADVEDGRKLLVTRPTDDWDYEDFRTFFGPPGDMRERQTHSVSRAKDGGSTTFDFEVASHTYTAKFPVVSDEQGFAWGEPSLDTGDDVLKMTRLEPTATAVAAFDVTCFP